MIVMSTTTGWNPGDDLIREGVYRLLDLDGREPVAWLSRLPIHCSRHYTGLDWVPAFESQYRPCELEELISNARAFVCAGTPEWLTSLETIWFACSISAVPIWLVGVGGPETDRFGAICATQNDGLIKVATTRDPLGEPLLAKAGVEFQRFLDPAFHANYAVADQVPGIVLNPRLETDDQVALYRDLYQRHKAAVRKVVVHEIREFQIALGMGFECPVWFSSDWRDYRSVYADCQVYLGGRLHGAIPALCAGATVHLVAHLEKHEYVVRWPGRIDQVQAYGLNQVATIDPAYCGNDMTALRGAVKADFNAHRNYIRERLSGGLSSPCA